MINHIRTAKKQIRRSPYQALSAIFTMAITFFVATVLGFLAYASYSTLKYFETRPQVIAFIKAEATPEQISQLQRDLMADSRIGDVKYVSKDQALEIYKEATLDNPLLSQFVSPKTFPSSIEFSVADLSYAENVVKETRGKNIVRQVGYTASLGGSENIGKVINKLQSITYYIRLGGAITLSFLLASSFLVLFVILGMRIASRRNEIEILQLIGATPGFIRAPFVFEAIFYSISGAFVGWLAAVLLALYVAPTLTNYFGEIPILPPGSVGFLYLFGTIFGGEFILAIILGTTGSFIAIKRYLRI